MQAIVHEMRQALSQLRHSPGFTVLAVVILGFGLGATLYMFTVVKAYMLTPLPYPEAERIMHLARANPLNGVGGIRVTPHDYIEWQRAQQSFAALAAFYTNSVALSESDLAERVDGAFVTPSAFDVVQVKAHIGRALAPADAAPGAPPAIVLGFDVWMNRYNGDPTIVGEDIRVNGVPTTVVGVMPPAFQFPSTQEVWLPLRVEHSEYGDNPYLWTVGRLEPGVTLEQARAEFANIAAVLAAQHPENRNITTSIKPYQHGFITADMRTVIAAMLAAVLFVLLIACSNVANLMLARTVARQKDETVHELDQDIPVFTREIGVRRALGAVDGRVLNMILRQGALQLGVRMKT